MASHWDIASSRSVLSGRNNYHGQMTTSQPPFAEVPSSTKPPTTPFSENHSFATPFSPPFAENQVMSAPYYEGYTIRPDDFASSEDRWSLPPKKSIPATQEDLHTEVIRQRQSGRTACRELEDCHGPKRQYIDRLIKERNASTSLGYFEVAQLRLERVPKDSGKTFNRNSSRISHARDYKQKDSGKLKQKTVYMHIILQFMKKSNKSFADIPSTNPAPGDLDVGNNYSTARSHGSDEGVLIASVSSDVPSSVCSGASRRPLLARGYPYSTRNEQNSPPPSTRYVSQGTQTTFPVHKKANCDCCGGRYLDDLTLENAPSEDIWRSETSNVKHEISKNSPSAHDEVVSTEDPTVACESVNESTKEASMDIDEYEKPPWFQNLRPVNSMTDEEPDTCDQQHDGESMTTQEAKDADDDTAPDDLEELKTHVEEDAYCAQSDIASSSGESISQNPSEFAAGHVIPKSDTRSPEKEDLSIATEVRKLDSSDDHSSSDPTSNPISEYLLNLPRLPSQERLPPSERYKPRPSLILVPARPSLSRSSATYDSRPTEDSEKRSSKRVSFQQAPTPLYTPPSTTNSSPVSSSASPQLPFRTISTKPPPVSIPPGQYTPVASSSPVSPATPPTNRKPYTCLEPACDGSFDYPWDRDRHERQHEIGDPPYSQCPICRHSRSSSAVTDVGLREMLIAHIYRRH